MERFNGLPNNGPPNGGEISIDQEGNWRHEGVKITHPGTIALFFKGLERDGDDKFLLRVGDQTAPVTVEDAPFVVRSIDDSGQQILLVLSDGEREPLVPDTLRQNADNVLYCMVKDGRFRARFTRAAYYLLTDKVDVDDDGNYSLLVAGESVLLPGLQ